jgi:hypothetical protein
VEVVIIVASFYNNLGTLLMEKVFLLHAEGRNAFPFLFYYCCCYLVNCEKIFPAVAEKEKKICETNFLFLPFAIFILVALTYEYPPLQSLFCVRELVKK